MKLIVGLGNPGKEYQNTRHNVGFIMVDNYCNRNEIIFKKMYNSLIGEKNINNEKYLFLKPQSYMNDSGTEVRKIVDYYHIDYKDILIIYDDINFLPGTFKIKKMGSSGGHNGINDVINKLNSQNISRIKIGIGKNKTELKNHVLKKMPKEEYENIMSIYPKVEEIINKFSTDTIDNIMNKYN